MTRAAVWQIASKDPNLMPIVGGVEGGWVVDYAAFSVPKECVGGGS